nr:hypothetical protein [Thermobaculum terrenum]
MLSISGAPSIPSSRRTITLWPVPRSSGMTTRQSSILTRPASQVNTVSRMLVSSRYRRLTLYFPTGDTCQNPPFSQSRRRQKRAGESKAGTHSQSTEPRLLTSAAVCMSPMIP